MIEVWLREAEPKRALKDAIPSPLHKQVEWHTVTNQSDFARIRPDLIVHHTKGTPPQAEWFAARMGTWIYYLPEAMESFQQSLRDRLANGQTVRVFSTELRKVSAQ